MKGTKMCIVRFTSEHSPNCNTEKISMAPAQGWVAHSPAVSIFVKVLQREHHRKSISLVDVYKGKFGKKKSYLLGLLAKIKV